MGGPANGKPSTGKGSCQAGRPTAETGCPTPSRRPGQGKLIGPQRRTAVWEGVFMGARGEPWDTLGSVLCALSLSVATTVRAAHEVRVVETQGLADVRIVSTGKSLPYAPLAKQLAPDTLEHILTGAARLEPLDHEALKAEDAVQGVQHKRLRVGVVRSIGAELRRGRWHRLPDGRSLWTWSLVSPGAWGIRVHVDQANLPVNAELRVWAPGLDAVEGAFTGRGPRNDGAYWTGTLPGPQVVVEYVAPRGATLTAEPPFVVDSVVHFYRDILKLDQDAEEGLCHNDSTCSPAWAEIRKSVARITFVENQTGFLCTGQLLNNAANDFTPFFLTANHCIASDPVANTLEAFWLYQTATCNGSAPSLATVPRSMNADFLAGSNANTEADASLLMLLGALPEDLFWTGWTTEPIAPGTPSTCIHHPEGTFKRISFGTRGIQLDSPDLWRIDWDDGPTEPGSSGSGLWRNDTQQLYGQLSRGISGCSPPSLEFTWDDFGMFAVAFNRFASFLAPGNDDDLEPNDSCPAAQTIDAGVHTNRIVKITDEDWYRISVSSCEDLEINLSFIHDYGDIDVDLFQACGGARIQRSDSAANREVLTVPSTGAPAEYLLRVYLFSGVRNTYNLTVLKDSLASQTTVTRYPGFGVPAAIPDLFIDPGFSFPVVIPLERNLSIVDGGVISDLDLELDISHTWNGDLSVELVKGSLSTLVIDQVGEPGEDLGFDNNGFDILLNDAAPLPIEFFDSGGPKVVGEFAPYPGALGLFNGLDRAGTWKLRIWDNTSEDTGTLNSWAMLISTVEPADCVRLDGAADACRLLDVRADLVDVAYLQTCFSGEGPAGLSECCSVFDTDGDDDVDAIDYVQWQPFINGP